MQTVEDVHGLFGAVCCFVSAAPERIGCCLPLPAALGLASVRAVAFSGTEIPRFCVCLNNTQD